MKGRQGLVPLLFALAPVAVYLGIAWACARPAPEPGAPADYYTLLAHGLLKGHLYLDTPVADTLLRLPNPYDPATRPPGSALHDASLYHRHYYLYFGITPVCLLLLPFAWLTHHDLPLLWAVWLFGSGTYLISLALLEFLRRRHFPAAPAALRAAAAAGLAFGGAELTLMVRHSVYELPIAAGSCLFLAALSCLLRSLDSSRPCRWSLAGGLLMGLAAGCRPFYALGFGLFLLPFLFRQARREQAAGYDWRALAAAALPWACVGCWLAAYNQARFGDPFEFGQRYQLSGAIEGQVRHFGLGYVPFNAYVYLLSPLRWGRYFPFVHNIAVPPLPAGFGGWEWSYGLLPNLPFSALALCGAFFLARKSPDRSRDSLLVLRLAVIAAAGMGVLFLLCCFFGSVARYQGDFAPPLLLLAAIGLLECHRRARSPAGKSRCIAAGWIAAVWTVGTALLAACLLYGFFPAESPRAFAFAARIANFPVSMAERLFGFHYGPMAVTLSLPAAPAPREPLLTSGWPGRRDGVWIEPLGGDRVRFSYAHGPAGIVAASPVIALGAADTHRLVLSFGSLYPPETHPFFFGVSAGRRSSLKRWVRVQCDGREVWKAAADSFEPAPATVRIGSDTDSATAFTGKVLASGRAPPLWGNDPLPPRRFMVAFVPAANSGNSPLPLFTQGHTLAGDALFLSVTRPGRARLGYDHWGSPPESSPEFALPPTGATELEIAVSPGSSPSRLRLLVSRARQPLWQAELPQFPAPEYDFFPARNPIGATTCRDEFPGVTVTAETSR